jgi:hypothetical protein
VTIILNPGKLLGFRITTSLVGGKVGAKNLASTIGSKSGGKNAIGAAGKIGGEVGTKNT